MRKHLVDTIKLLSSLESDLRFKMLKDVLLEKDWNTVGWEETQKYCNLIDKLPLARVLMAGCMEPGGTVDVKHTENGVDLEFHTIPVIEVKSDKINDRCCD